MKRRKSRATTDEMNQIINLLKEKKRYKCKQKKTWENYPRRKKSGFFHYRFLPRHHRCERKEKKRKEMCHSYN